MVGFSINAAGCLTSVARNFNKLVLDCYLTSWDSAVGIATDYGLDG
jgi:hypothetical protein